jgi:SAM-dependent methyltransferase
VARVKDDSAESADSHDKTRLSYDAVAADYADHFRDELDHKPFDRALLATIVEECVGGLPVADLGCGPGHVAAWLAAAGVAGAVGIDLSPEMVTVGQTRYPSVEFRAGDLCRLPAGDGEFGAAVAFYSIIHLLPDDLPIAFAEFGRCLAPGAPLLVSFHAGTGTVHRDEWFGRTVDVDFRFLEADRVVELLEASGLEVTLRAERRAYPEEVDTRRAYLLARRPR